MKRRQFTFFFILPLLLMSGCPLLAGEFLLSGCIRGAGNSGISLSRFYGDSEITAGTSIIKPDGCFSLRLNDSMPSGQYRLKFSDNRFLDLIFTHEHIRFQTTLEHLIDSIQFQQSAENELYYRYLRFRSKSRYRIRQLQHQPAVPQPGDELNKNNRAELLHIFKQEDDFVQGLLYGHEHFFAARLIRIDREPHPDPANAQSFRNRYVFSRFLSYLNYSDTLLLFTNALSAEIISYLSLVPVIWPHHDSTVYGFRLAAFNLLTAADRSEKMFHFIKNYLINGFTRLGYPQIAEELSETAFLSGHGLNENFSSSESIHRIKSKKKSIPRDILEGCRLPETHGNAQAYMIVLSQSECVRSEIARHNIGQSLKFSPFSDYIPITLIPAGTAADPVYTNEVICTVNPGALKKVTDFAGKDDTPLLILINGKGKIDKVAGSWAELIRESGL